MKKLFTMFVMLCLTASMNAQVVTFSYKSGQNNDNWDGATQPSKLNTGEVWRANPGANTYAIFKASQATYIQGYRITVAATSTDGSPYTWNLMGSNDSINWTPIHSQVQANNIKEDRDADNTAIDGRSYTYYCNTSTKYLYYKISITAKYGGSYGCFRMYRFDLIPSSVGFSAPGNGMDGNTGTKMEGNGGNTSHTITVTGTASSRISGFQFTTADDNATRSGRNPQNIQVEGSTDNTNWTSIQSWENYTGLEDKNYYPYVFKFDSPQEYQYYKFTFSNISATWFQMSELALITPLKISTSTDLTNFASLVNTGTTDADAVLTADIDMSAVDYTPIGTSSYKYTGTFDGRDNSVTLAINTTNSNQGLFGYAKGGVTIKNLIVKGTINCGGSSAALIGEASSGIINISRVGCEATVNGGTADRIGAFVGNDLGYGAALNIENSYNIGNITGNSWLSSVVGCHLNAESTFTNVYNKGTISSNNFYTDAKSGITCTNCYSTGSGNSGTDGLTTSYPSSKVTSGELCYLLNGSSCYEPNWFQNLTGTADANPVLSNTHGIVNKISAAGYTTQYISGTDVTIPDGVEAYTGVILSEGWLHLNAIENGKIAAGEAVILKGNEGYYSFMPTTDAEKVDDNVLIGSDGTITGGDGIYALAKKGNPAVVGFYSVDSDVPVPAGKVYLDSDGSLVKVFKFAFDDDDETGLNSPLLTSPEEEGQVYNLAGQRVSKLQKGINIINGKKVLK